MPERFCNVGRGVTLCYETFGERDDPPILLIMGLATQMLGWHQDFCRELAERGFFVVRFDNRDVGHSTHFDFRAPSIGQLVSRRFGPKQYELGEMAEDAAGLLRELDLAPAHIVGASMGGMIAQTLAAREPETVRSLTSIMSTTGSRFHGQPSPLVYRVFLKARPADRDAYLEYMVGLFKAIGSPPPNQDLDQIRELITQSMARDTDPFGRWRQLGAILASGDRSRELQRIKAPTLVMHGTRDRLINPSGGRASAQNIPGARLVTIAGMGHDLPRAFWPRLLEEISAHAHAVDESAAGETGVRVASSGS